MKLPVWGNQRVAIITKDLWIVNYVMFVDESGDHNLRAIDNERPFSVSSAAFLSAGITGTLSDRASIP